MNVRRSATALTVGPALLRALRRATRRAAFETRVTFDGRIG